jgi:hypothetical protein
MNYNRLSIYTILSIFVITAIFGYFAISRIKFDFDMRNFYPLNNPETDFFYQYTDEFGWDDDYILIGLETKGKDVFEQKFLKAVDSLGKLVRKHHNVKNVASPTEMEIYRYVPYMNVVSNSPLIHLDEPDRLANDRKTVMSRKELVGNLFAPDKKSVAIIIKQLPNLQYENCDSLVKHLEKLVQPFSEFKKVHFAGKCFGQTTFVNLTKTEIVLFILLSMIVNIVFLYFTYRRFWGILMPLMVVGVTVLWTLGTMMMLGLSLDFISNIIPTIILIIGISNVIHFLTHFLKEMDSGMNKIDAIKATIKKIGTATIFTSITTIIGFLSLLFSNVKPLVNLGGYASLGLVFAFIITYSLFPAILIVYNPKYSSKSKSANDFLQNILEPLFNFTMKFKLQIIIVSSIIIAFGVWGSLNLVVNQHLLEDINERHPQIQATRFFENDFSGARQFEMEVRLLDSTKSVLEPEVLKTLDKVDKYLSSTYGAGALFSPVGLYREANRVQHSGQNAYFVLPDNESDYNKAKDLVDRFISKAYPKVYTADLKTARFSGKMGDLGSNEINKRNKALAEFMKKEGLDKQISWHVTGSAHLMELNNFNIASNVYYGMIFSCLIVSLIIGFQFGSVRMAIIGMITNILPMLFVGALMAFSGVNIKISTSILFIMSFGIAVDDTIHFMSSYRFDSKKYPNDRTKALLETYKSTGKAIIVTSLILIGGFSTLIFSSFGGTFHIGVFTSICLFIALLADLFLLPALLFYFGTEPKPIFGKKKKKA